MEVSFLWPLYLNVFEFNTSKFLKVDQKFFLTSFVAYLRTDNNGMDWNQLSR